MSDKITSITDISELKYCQYSENNHQIGVHTNQGNDWLGIEMYGGKMLVSLGCERVVMSREALTEFLHVAKTLVDSEDRFVPKVELIGFSYE